jgi:putative ABC transport system permease protein
MTNLAATTQRAPLLQRLTTMTRVGISMLFHDKLKLLGTLFGVVFAVVLSDQQAGTFLGVIHKNVMFVERSDADLWMIPVGVEVFGPGRDMSTSNATMAKGTRGVAWAEPMILGNVPFRLPTGGSEQVTLVGCKHPYTAGGPWGLARGEASALARPSTVIVEHGDRVNLGGLNLGSVRELGGRRITVGGFTWGLVPFGASYAFADYDLAREIMGVKSDRANYVLVRVEPGEDVARVKSALAARADNAQVLTKQEFTRVIIRHLLLKTAIGVTFGTSTMFGLVIGFVIVALSMFSSVVDNLREFGTLKAIGATNTDLMILLFTQAIAVALLGSMLGLALVSEIAILIRNPRLAVLLPSWLMAGSAALMVVICVVASSLALLRIRRVEPAMVFR